uniref:Uncharacterized protein n=1 Tax=Strigamia maritima TaxID=126957 RepID=T1ITG4_STRMM
MISPRSIVMNQPNSSWQKKKTKKNFTNKYKTPTKKAKYTARIVDPKRSRKCGKGIIYNFLRFLVISFSVLTCSYQIFDRFLYFLSFPIDTKVTVTRNLSVKFPSITLCPPENNYMPMVILRLLKAKRRNVTFCEIHVFTFLNALNISKLWEYLSFNGTLRTAYTHARSTVIGSIQSNNIFPEKITNTFFGSCHTYTFKNLITFKIDDFKIGFAANQYLSRCHKAPSVVWYMMHHDDEILNYKVLTGYRDLQFGNNLVYGLSAKRFKLLNRTDQLCDINKVVNKCQLNCIENALKNISHCRLPFTSLSELPWCVTQSDVTNMLKKVKDFILSFNYMEKCVCPKICDQIEYNRYLEFIEIGNETSLSIVFAHNIIEEIEEYYAYTVIPFICDLGGSLGLFLGLSILSVCQKHRIETQKKNYDSHKGVRELSTLKVGEAVWIIDLRRQGIITALDTAPRSYIIETDKRTIRRNRYHLVPLPNSLPGGEEEEEDSAIDIFEDSSIDSTTPEPTMGNEETQAERNIDPTPTDNVPLRYSYVTRSGRGVKTP